MKVKNNYWLPDYDEWFEKAFTRPHFWSIRKRAIEACLRRRVAVDVGAHVGTWTVPMANVFQQVFAFEPIRTNFQCLLRNTQPLSNVQPACLALGRDPGATVRFSLEVLGNSGTWTIKPGAQGPWAQVYTLDRFYLDGLMPVVDFLKIDAEGCEMDVLEGASAVLVNCQPVVCVETHNLPPVRRWLEGCGYALDFSVDRDYVFKVPQ